MYIRQKVLAYITHNSSLLVFRHPDKPQRGLQVPGGTVEVGESLEQAVLREVWEETGLSQVKIVGYLGNFKHYHVTPLREFHAYHLELTEEVPCQWRHYEMNPGTGTLALTFDFHWVRLESGGPSLARGQEIIPKLRTLLQAAA
ncbi:MAG: NUDIX domain-containing protein [Synechococcales bacterium]|nr:NUDIX domain-containing protein [Synechococcales bacterium]